MDNKKFSLVDFSQEELTNFNNDIKAVLDKYSAHFEGEPLFVRQNFGEAFQVSVQYIAKKKVELVPKETVEAEKIVSPLSEEMTGNAAA